MAETPSGMLNSIGLQGPGIDGLLADDLPWLAERGVPAFVSIAGTRVEDFAELATRLRGVPGVLGLEVNISCPNVESRGEVFACDPVAAADVVAAVRQAADPAQPVYAKLSPDVTDIVPVARSVMDAGADGLSMINTLLGLVIDPDTMRPALGGITGGLRSEEHTSELQSRQYLVCRLLLEKKKITNRLTTTTKMTNDT